MKIDWQRGLVRWYAQRVTAVLMAPYVLGLIVIACLHPHWGYAEWALLHHHSFVLVLMWLAWLSLALHAQLGLWTVLTDYTRGCVQCTLLWLVHGLLAVQTLALFVLTLWSLL